MSYSKYDLLSQELGGLIKSKNFMQRIMGNWFNYSLEIPLPYQIYKEAEIVCLGLEEEINEKVTPEVVLDVLVEDFVSYIRLNHNPQKIHSVLREHCENPLIINFYNQEPVIISGKPLNKTVFSQIKLTKNELLSIEYTLDKIHNMFEDLFTVEEVISFIFIDLFDKYSKGDDKPMRNIIRKLRGIDDIARNVRNINEKRGFVNHGTYQTYGNGNIMRSESRYEY